MPSPANHPQTTRKEAFVRKVSVCVCVRGWRALMNLLRISFSALWMCSNAMHNFNYFDYSHNLYEIRYTYKLVW